MNRQDLLRTLTYTLDDRRISRSERKALRAIITESTFSAPALRALRHDVLVAAGERMEHPRDRELISWLDEALSLLEREEPRYQPSPQVLFGPEDPMVESLVSHLDQCLARIDAAVFTVTDDRVRDALLRAVGRGAKVRLLTDGDKGRDPGSDIAALESGGVKVRRDWSDRHFHHKFAVFDGRAVATGSYNWTRSADQVNRENLLFTWDPEVVGAYERAFQRMWEELAS